jgi:spore maturation protein B
VQVGQAGWVRVLNAVSVLAIPVLLTLFPLYAALRGVAVYEEFVEGAKEGFQVAVKIIPFLVAMLVAIGFLRGAGAIEGFTNLLRGPLEAVGFPPELLPMSLIRPLSGSASLAAFSDIVKTFGPDSLLARMAGTLFGSTETTFYVIAVYFGSVAVRRVRHAVWAGLDGGCRRGGGVGARVSGDVRGWVRGGGGITIRSKSTMTRGGDVHGEHPRFTNRAWGP